jgi:hypothetical protein
MAKILRFKGSPTLESLKGLEVNGSPFQRGKGQIEPDGIVMKIPNTFRFETYLEIAETTNGGFNLVMSQFLTRGPHAWEMEEAFGRIGFRDPEIEGQMRSLCNELVERGVAEWEEV